MMAFGFTPAVTLAQNGPDITIPAGTDFLYTQPGSFYDFPAPIGPVALTGIPTYAGGSDTVVQRLADADATTGAPIDCLLTGLALTGQGPTGAIVVTLDPAHLADDTGTMSFSTVGPTVPGTEIGGTITDTLNVYFQAVIPSVGTITGHESFTSTGTWEAFLPVGSNEVTDFRIIIDFEITPNGQHVVSTSVPEPGTWVMLAAVGLMVPAYARWGRRRA
jgi:hypothetical protein